MVTLEALDRPPQIRLAGFAEDLGRRPGRIRAVGPEDEAAVPRAVIALPHRQPDGHGLVRMPEGSEFVQNRLTETGKAAPGKVSRHLGASEILRKYKSNFDLRNSEQAVTR
jgi:hypothetical protein